MRRIAASLAAPLILLILVSFGSTGYTQPYPPHIVVTPSPAAYLPLMLGAEPTYTPIATPTSTTTPTVSVTATRTATATVTVTPTRDPAQCAAEYPTVCISPPPPDLDCGDISYRNFTVLPPDRHNFDSDDDGAGCEA